MLSESELVVNKSSRKQLVLVQDYLRVMSTAAYCLLNYFRILLHLALVGT